MTEAADAEDMVGAGGPALVSVATTEEVLLEEHRHIWPGQAQPKTLDEYHAQVLRNGQAALCLSGGGMRSAAFCLGVIQALSRKRVLTGFHYVSTVAGGGYIGGWLQRWIHELDGDAGAAMERLGQDTEPPEVTALRESFSSGSTNGAAPDPWVRSTLGMRNILGIWMLFAPILLLVAMLLALLSLTIGHFPRLIESSRWLLPVVAGLAALALATASFWTVRAVPSYRLNVAAQSRIGNAWLTRRIVFPAFCWAVLATIVASADLVGDAQEDLSIKARVLLLPADVTFGTGNLLAISTAGAMLSGFVLAGATLARGRRRTFVRDLALWVVTGLTASLVVLAGTLLFPERGQTSDGLSIPLLVILGPAWLLLSQILGQIVFVALRGVSGRGASGADTEWLARASALLVRPMLLWACAAFALLLLLPVLFNYLEQFDLPLPGLLAIGTGLIAAIGGRRSADLDANPLLRFLPLSAIVALASALFFVILLTIFGPFEQAGANVLGGLLKPAAYLGGEWLNETFGFSLAHDWIDVTVAGHILIGLVLILFLWLGRKIPLNRFSLTAIHRSRLVGTFLGSARSARAPDSLTGFEPADDVRLALLRPRDKERPVLYPIVNCAMNVTIETNRASVGREPLPFVFTPDCCGSAFLQPEQESESGTLRGAFVDTHLYGDQPGGDLQGSGISLASAMTTSGAAADRETGYHQSALTSLLLALFGARLGAWMPNPARGQTLGSRVTRSEPVDSVAALLREVGGAITGRSLDIYLSDGGHFENLGLYEMIRRRCRFIVVVDASTDPSATMADLGNAVRRVKADFNVDIAFEDMRIASRAKPVEGQRGWALGQIGYSDERIGYILYIKPSFFQAHLPVDVISYAASSDAFPHESGSDQLFSEAQFESYRKLGFASTMQIGQVGPNDTYGSVADFFRAVEEMERRART